MFSRDPKPEVADMRLESTTSVKDPGLLRKIRGILRMLGFYILLVILNFFAFDK